MKTNSRWFLEWIAGLVECVLDTVKVIVQHPRSILYVGVAITLVILARQGKLGTAELLKAAAELIRGATVSRP